MIYRINDLLIEIKNIATELQKENDEENLELYTIIRNVDEIGETLEKYFEGEINDEIR